MDIVEREGLKKHGISEEGFGSQKAFACLMLDNGTFEIEICGLNSKFKKALEDFCDTYFQTLWN